MARSVRMTEGASPPPNTSGSSGASGCRVIVTIPRDCNAGICIRCLPMHLILVHGDDVGAKRVWPRSGGHVECARDGVSVDCDVDATGLDDKQRTSAPRRRTISCLQPDEEVA